MKKYLLAFLSTASIEAQAQPTALLATGGQCAAAPCAVTAITTGKSGSIGTRTARSPPREHALGVASLVIFIPATALAFAIEKVGGRK